MRVHRAWLALLALALIALVAAGCGGGGSSSSGGESGGGEAAEEPAGGEGGGETEASEESSGGESEGGGSDYKIAMIIPGSANDHGYNEDAKRSAELIEKETGSTVDISEAVAVANQADVYRQYATQGYNLVIGWGGQFSDGAVQASEEFPETEFLVSNSNVENGSNLASMDTSIEQWQFFAGFVAAKLSKDHTVGWIGGECFPATAANLYGTEAGAKYADPSVDFKFKFTNTFEDPTKAQSAAEALIGEGVDSITGNLNNAWPGVYKAAEENGDLPVVTEWVDNHEQAPKVIASSVLKSQAKFLAEMAEEAEEGTLKGEFHLFPLPEDWGPIVAQTSLLPPEVFKEAEALKAKVASGQIKVPRKETCPS
jgi:basic membrane protein A and related proteins